MAERPENKASVRRYLEGIKYDEWLTLLRYFLPQLQSDQDFLTEIIDHRCKKEKTTLPRLLRDLGATVVLTRKAV